MSFTNETLDTTALPRFEAVSFRLLDARYWTVIWLSLLIVFGLLAAAIVLVAVFVEDTGQAVPWMIGGYVIGAAISFWLSRIAFRRKGYAFREHDVVFRHGIIATKTIVIPYNRVQHVALHEGVFSRIFGLAEVQVYTAGGNSGDIDIPGIRKPEAEDIKQLLMGKIQKQL